MSTQIGPLYISAGRINNKICTITIGCYAIGFCIKFALPGNKMNKYYNSTWITIRYPKFGIVQTKARVIYAAKREDIDVEKQAELLRRAT